MATILLSALGAAAGASVGSGILGLSSVVIGRAAGAVLGRALDQKLMGSGSQTVERGRVDRLRLTGASEGAALGQLYGRMRLGGQVIWASRFKEHRANSGGGKGAPAGPQITEYSYSVSLAIALCEGEITHIGRIWADGVEIAPADLTLRLYHGDDAQLPDPKIEAVEGEGRAPAYRGTAYVVIEKLDLTPYGTRVPQFTFEVFRPAQPDSAGALGSVARGVRAVALIPGTGEYALADGPVYYKHGAGDKRPANIATPSGQADFTTSLQSLDGELPNCGGVSLVVSWFGDDLRAGQCSIRPKVEQNTVDGDRIAWRAGGITRAQAQVLAQDAAGGSIYGGTPADGAVIEAIKALNAAGKAVTFYPFILMEQRAGNGLPDPYGGEEQAALPWRGRITTALAPDQLGTSDGSAAAEAEVAAFFGAAAPAHFSVAGNTVSYSGPASDWGLRRMILHYAHLCAAAGGVSAFCIGSEMRGLTRIMGAQGFPAVDELRALAADVRAILGAGCKISYAADWSEYGAYSAPNGDLRFPLDPLWADDAIDFIGIDNYMPLSDWRDGEDHADAAYGSIYAQDYLKSNIEGGEMFDWYYAAPEHMAAQIRTPITDGAYGTPWIYRAKDLRSWWEQPHLERIAGRQGNILPMYGALSDVWSSSAHMQVFDDFTDSPYADRRAHRCLSNGTNDYLLRPSMPLEEGARYRLRMVARSNTGADQITHMNSYDGAHHREARVIGSEWQEHLYYFTATKTAQNVYPSDPRTGPDSGSLDILIAEVSLERVEVESIWQPRSKPIWFTELGCAAIDKGTNEPNRFLDPKSSESGLPRASNGQRDDFIQMQYLRAMFEYWQDAGHNPPSDRYEGSMIDMSRAHVWAWDARPYPAFPGNQALWSDGGNYARGHWLNGRSTNRALADVVAEICARAGLGADQIDTSALWGLVRGYHLPDGDSARAALEPLMLAYGFEAIERDGKLTFRTRNGRSSLALRPDLLALPAQADSALALTRAPHAEVAGRVQLTFIEADGDYAARAEEAIFSDTDTDSQTSARSELPLALTRAEGRQIAERWLAEARVARDSLRFALPLSQLATGAGDVVQIDTPSGPERYRIDRLTQGDTREAEAQRVEPEIYQPSDATEDFPTPRAFAAPVPIFNLMMDLPLMRGDEQPHAPHFASAAVPWPGAVAVYSAAQDAGYALNRLVAAPAVIGITQSPLAKAPSGLWDRGPALRVRLIAGTLESADPAQLLDGANLVAIGDGTSANWELFQFATASLVAPQTYDLSLRLRGQQGSDALAADWPAGSQLVLLDGSLPQLDLAPSARGLVRHYRIGPASRPYDDPVFDHRIEAFQGIGLRPYAPAHLRAQLDMAGDLHVRWIRRTRINGDSWAGVDVPLGEAVEAYHLRILASGQELFTATPNAPALTISAAQLAAAGVSAPFEIQVAQLSDSFGAGLYGKVQIDG